MTLSTARVIGLLTCVAGIAGVTAPALAKPGFAIVSLSPQKFVSNCQSMGGTSSQAPGGGIRCTLPSGQTVDCSFNTNDGSAVCQWTKDLPPKSAKALMGDVPPDSLAPTTSKPPKATDAPSTVN
ncbi:hypothetical protein [Dongia deserti]|uniref:hypothetical protein n=1 Tax=Dongia deserti TaxID=2268030 RepID=UPI0013C42A62|nr:hypothetical protein [Dongia deserti]